MARQQPEDVTVAGEVRGGQPQRARHGDGLRGAHHRGRPLHLPALRRTPLPEVAEHGDQGLQDGVVDLEGRARPLHRRPGLAADQRGLGVEVRDGADRLEVEAALERGRHLGDALVPQVGGGDEGEARRRVRQRVLAARQFGDRDTPLRQQRHQGVLHLGKAPGDLLDTGHRAPAHRGEHRRRHQRGPAGALREQQGVVPAVLQLVLRRTRRALHDQPAGSAHGGGQQLRQHGLGGAGLADEQQAPLPGERDDTPFHQRAVADELAADLQPPRHSVRHRGVLGQTQRLPAAAHHEGDHGPGREPPGGRPRTGIVSREERQLGGVPVLGRNDLSGGVGNEDGRHRRESFEGVRAGRGTEVRGEGERSVVRMESGAGRPGRVRARLGSCAAPPENHPPATPPPPFLTGASPSASPAS
ncbi:hypothetical protein GPN2_13300 [Streptomyces murinus]